MTEPDDGAWLSPERIIEGSRGLSGFADAFAAFQRERDAAEAAADGPTPPVEPDPEPAASAEEVEPAPVSPEPGQDTTAPEAGSEPEAASFTEPEPEPVPVGKSSLPASSPVDTTPIFTQLFQERFPDPKREEPVADQPGEPTNEATTPAEAHEPDATTGPQASATSVEPAWPDPDVVDPDTLGQPPADEEEGPSKEAIVPPPAADFSAFPAARRLSPWSQLNILRAVRFVIVMLLLDQRARAKRP